MVIVFFVWYVVKLLLNLASTAFTVWLLPIIILGVILSVVGIKVGRLGSAILRVLGQGIVTALTAIVNAIPRLFKGIVIFYTFLTKRAFRRLPTWVANTLAIIIIAII